MNRQFEEYVLPSATAGEIAESAARQIQRARERMSEATAAAASKLLEWQTAEGFCCAVFTWSD